MINEKRQLQAAKNSKILENFLPWIPFKAVLYLAKYEILNHNKSW